MAAAAQRAGRDADSVRLVAVSKTKSAELVRAAIDAGVHDIGENYVQEAAAKRAAVGEGARWHLIGHLQRNKAQRALETFDVIQTIDSAALGTAVARHAAARSQTVSVLVEVNVGGEASKSGFAAQTTGAMEARLREFEQVAALPGIEVRGLMTMAPIVDSAAAARPYFERLRQMRDLAAARVGGAWDELSMGMTDDYEAAIAEGATLVRIGRAIFGERA